MVNIEDVERNWKSYAPGSRPHNLTQDLLDSGEASDGFLGMQGNRNELIGAILNEGIVDGLTPSPSGSGGNVDISTGIVLIWDTGISHFVVKQYAGGTAVVSAGVGEIVYLTCSSGILTVGSSAAPPANSAYLCVFISNSEVVDIRKSAHIRSPAGNTGIPNSLTICGPNDAKKFVVRKADGTEIFSIDTVNNLVSAISSTEHAINADRLNGLDDYYDFNGTLGDPNPSTDYIPVADFTQTLQPNLNAQILEGKRIVSSGGDIPLIGNVNPGLNADTLDTWHSGSSPAMNTIPVSDVTAKIDNGWLKTGSGNGIDADMVDAFHLNQDVRSSATPSFAGFGSVGSKILYLTDSQSFTGSPSPQINIGPGVIRLIFQAYVTTTTDAAIYLRFNNDSATTKYSSARHWAGSGTHGASNASFGGIEIGLSVWSGNTFIIGDITILVMLGIPSVYVIGKSYNENRVYPNQLVATHGGTYNDNPLFMHIIKDSVHTALSGVYYVYRQR